MNKFISMTMLALVTTALLANFAAATQAAQLNSPFQQVALQRPKAPEVWVMRVEYRSRRGPQFAWGPWRSYTTVTGDYITALRRANNVADMLNERSKNMQSRVIERRVR